MLIWFTTSTSSEAGLEEVMNVHQQSAEPRDSEAEELVNNGYGHEMEIVHEWTGCEWASRSERGSPTRLQQTERPRGADPPSLDNWTSDKSTSVKVLTPLEPVVEKFIFHGGK